MTISIEQISIPTSHGPLAIGIVKPAGSGPWPAVVLLQEGLGVTAHLRKVAERFATVGYLVAVPDLDSRDATRKSLADQAVAEYLPLARATDRDARLAALPSAAREVAKRVLSWSAARDTSTHFPDVQVAVAAVVQRDDVQAEAIAAVGFSLGGGLVGQLAGAGAGLAAGVVFYGAPPAPERADRVRFPILGHFAADDANVNPRVEPFARTLQAAGKPFEFFVYAGTRHGFFNETRSVHDAQAAALAWTRTLGFLDRHLGHEQGVRQAIGGADATP